MLWNIQSGKMEKFLRSWIHCLNIQSLECDFHEEYGSSGSFRGFIPPDVPRGTREFYARSFESYESTAVLKSVEGISHFFMRTRDERNVLVTRSSRGINALNGAIFGTKKGRVTQILRALKFWQTSRESFQNFNFWLEQSWEVNSSMS